MEIIDLTQTIKEEMPVYPGTEKPLLKRATTIEKDGFAEKLLTMYSHTGTHMDAPAHMLSDGPTLDEYGVSSFMGSGVVIDAGAERVTRRRIEEGIAGAGKPDFLLFHTGWGRKWGTDSYFSGFPVLDGEAAEYAAGLGIKGVGVDCISVDPVMGSKMENHLTLMKRGITIVENLCSLERLAGREFLFCCFPLKIDGADGSPVRAVGILGGGAPSLP